MPLQNLTTQNMTVVQRLSARAGALLLLPCLSLLALTGCQSAGKQYAFPKESEPAATVVGSSPFFLVTVDHTGCYWGRTAIDAHEPVRLQPDVLTEVAQEGNLTAPYPINDIRCNSFATFTPRRGEHYLVKSEGTPSHRDAQGNVILGRCVTGVWRQLPGGEVERVPNEPRPPATRRGFSCLMPEKAVAEKQ